MRIDYHMHFEYGVYELDWVRGFFKQARKNGVDELGISEHSHGFAEFRDLYYEELILDDSVIGRYQRQWLNKNKFRYTLQDYFSLMDQLKTQGYPVKTGIEVCNFHNQKKVKEILDAYPFDYVIGSIHFLQGWGYDFADLLPVWDEHRLTDIYDWYAAAVEELCAAGLYDVLGHPFNIRLFKHFPDFDPQPYLDRVANALHKAGMAMDINTGTLYRYPVAEISPYPKFMKTARRVGLPIITSSDAHQPEDCGRFIDEAVAYARQYGWEEVLTFDRRRPSVQRLE
ncbi:MAG TPA: histidinol-phosphatase [Patescibacteria group bacterium]|nr:histidinol-phosphatase [Patescibacteria group bacterium]